MSIGRFFYFYTGFSLTPGPSPTVSDVQTMNIGTNIDTAVQSVLDDQTLSRDSKINTLWAMAQANQADPLRFSYVLDTLSLG